MKEKRFKKIYNQGAIDNIEIWVDTETGVNYMFKSSGYAGGLTPLLKYTFLYPTASFLPCILAFLLQFSAILLLAPGGHIWLGIVTHAATAMDSLCCV